MYYIDIEQETDKSSWFNSSIMVTCLNTKLKVTAKYKSGAELYVLFIGVSGD